MVQKRPTFRKTIPFLNNDREFFQGGYPTTNEMCIAAITYYPKGKGVLYCETFNDLREVFLTTLGAKDIKIPLVFNNY